MCRFVEWHYFHVCQIPLEMLCRVFPPEFLAIICCYHGNALSTTFKKSYTCTPRGQHVCKISFKMRQTCGSYRPMHHKFSPYLLPYAITMVTHFPPLSKSVSHTCTPQGQHVCKISFKMRQKCGNTDHKFSHLLPYAITMVAHFPPL